MLEEFIGGGGGLDWWNSVEPNISCVRRQVFGGFSNVGKDQNPQGARVLRSVSQIRVDQGGSKTNYPFQIERGEDVQNPRTEISENPSIFKTKKIKSGERAEN